MSGREEKMDEVWELRGVRYLWEGGESKGGTLRVEETREVVSHSYPNPRTMAWAWKMMGEYSADLRVSDGL